MGMAYDWEIVFGIFLPVSLFPFEPAGALILSKTKEWWDLQEYDDKLSFLSLLT